MPKKTKILTSLIIIVSLALAVVVAELFSSIITVGDFAFISTSQSKVSGYNIYAVAVQKTTTKNNAQSLAKEIQYKNGAGYIYEKDNIYYILASAYESENDAVKVLENLTNQNINGEIIQISVSDVEINLSLSGKEKIAFNNALNIFKSTFKSLYDISISLDTNVKSQTECKLAVSDLKANLTKVISNYETHFNSKLTQDLVSLKLKLDELDKILQSLYEDNLTDLTSFSSILKYSYINVVMLNIDVCNIFK